VSAWLDRDLIAAGGLQQGVRHTVSIQAVRMIASGWCTSFRRLEAFGSCAEKFVSALRPGCLL
jgi:hypothetical protein